MTLFRRSQNASKQEDDSRYKDGLNHFRRSTYPIKFEDLVLSEEELSMICEGLRLLWDEALKHADKPVMSIISREPSYWFDWVCALQLRARFEQIRDLAAGVPHEDRTVLFNEGRNGEKRILCRARLARRRAALTTADLPSDTTSPNQR